MNDTDRQQDVYHRFWAEVDALTTISADAPAEWVVGELTRAAKRAQNAYDAAIGETPLPRRRGRRLRLPRLRGTDPALVEGYCTCLDKAMRDCGISAHRRAAGAGAPDDEALHFEKAQPNAITRAMTGPPRPVSGHAGAAAPDDEALRRGDNPLADRLIDENTRLRSERNDAFNSLAAVRAELAAMRANNHKIAAEAERRWADHYAPIRAQIKRYDEIVHYGQREIESWVQRGSQDPGFQEHPHHWTYLSEVERGTLIALLDRALTAEDNASALADRIAAVRAVVDAPPGPATPNYDRIRSALESSTGTKEASDGATD